MLQILYLEHLFRSSCFTHQYKNSIQFYFYSFPIASQNTKGKIYYASGSKNAEYKVEIGLVEVTVPAGKYLVLAANSVTTPNTGQMSCGLGASSGTLIGVNTTRTESTSGGGVVNFAYLDTDNISTIKTSGYGYNDESYMYRSILVAIRL